MAWINHEEGVLDAIGCIYHGQWPRRHRHHPTASHPRDKKEVFVMWQAGHTYEERGDIDKPIHAYSITKSMLGLALMHEFSLRPETSYKTFEEGGLDSFATHTSAFSSEAWNFDEYVNADDVGEYAAMKITKRKDSAQDGKFEYNDLATQAIESFLEQKMSITFTDMLYRHLSYLPQILRKFSTDRFSGTPRTANGLVTSARALLHIGVHILFNYKQYTSSRFHEKAFEKDKNATNVSDNNTVWMDGADSYSMLWWHKRGEWIAAYGVFGQYLIVYPETSMVVVRLYDPGDDYSQEAMKRADIPNFAAIYE